MFKRRYYIQACNLDTVIRKSQIKWLVFDKAWTLDSAKKKAAEARHFYSNLNYEVRVFDTKSGKAVA